MELPRLPSRKDLHKSINHGFGRTEILKHIEFERALQPRAYSAHV